MKSAIAFCLVFSSILLFHQVFLEDEAVLFTDPIYCSPCKELEKELRTNSELNIGLDIVKLKIFPDGAYPENYPNNSWPDGIEGVPALKLKDGMIVYGSSNILRVLKNKQKQ